MQVKKAGTKITKKVVKYGGKTFKSFDIGQKNTYISILKNIIVYLNIRRKA